MRGPGYYRFPTIHSDAIAFVSEDDLWLVPAEGGPARRLTAGLGRALFPRFSPDGSLLAFSGQEEGPLEVYVMPAAGGQPKRLTYLGGDALVCGWTPQGEALFASSATQPFPRFTTISAVSPDGGAPRELPIGCARTTSLREDGAVVLGRYGMVSREPAYWKRYRGGTAGDLWVDAAGDGRFERLIELDGNLTDPLWLGDRVFFVSDHDGIGNLYSCSADGRELSQHTEHDDFYVRHPATDGTRIVYHAGADLYLFDPANGRSVAVEIDYPGPRTQRNRKFVDSGRYWDEYTLHPKGHLLSISVRGKPFTLGAWEGPVVQRGEPEGVRYRQAQWLNDGERMVMVSDREGEEYLELHAAEPGDEPRRFTELDLGRIQELRASPTAPALAVTNHRRELYVVDVEAGSAVKVDQSEHFLISSPAWSPDGRWIAYSFQRSLHQAELRIYDSAEALSHSVTEPILVDGAPCFDANGKYLYFLSQREFNPVYDGMQFDLGFPAGVKPFLVTLRRDVENPFLPQPQPDSDEASRSDGAGAAGGDGSSPDSVDEAPPVEIDFDGIEQRILPFPLEEARYRRLAAMADKVLFSTVPVAGALSEEQDGSAPPAKATLSAFDFKTQQSEVLVTGITSFSLSGNRKKVAYRAGNKLRVIEAGSKPDEKNGSEGAGRKSGWVDLGRVRVSVHPPAEWAQMLKEAWRLQRDNFWNPAMSGVDWSAVYRRYAPLIDRVSTRSEFSDLTWEMQGELGTSHAYEFGGDYRPHPQYSVGFLGCDLAFDSERGLWRIERIVRGDSSKEGWGSPLAAAGAGVTDGQSLLAINGRAAGERLSPPELLVNQAESEISVTVGDESGGSPRTIVVKTLASERKVRYREWVELKRSHVHRETEDRVGYIHIPDMGPGGYAEFHRSYLPEVDRRGLIVDVRFNRGGHVSALLLEKLARRRIAYVATRWFGIEPWPEDSPPRPMVALTNEWAGSDGDIFSHSFKLLELGPLIGVRTWGGVIGIWPRQYLVDRTMTSQPEFSFWFTDVGWKVENYGTEPDIHVEITPQDYAAGRDPQLDRAVDEVERLVADHREPSPDVSEVPSRELPRLPRRE